MAADWQKVKEEYIAGGVSYKDLAEKYGLSQSTLRQRAAREKWSESKNNVRTNVEQNLQKRVTKKRTEELLRGMDVIKESTDIISDAMGKLALIVNQTPEYLLTSPALLTSLSTSMDKTYELMRKMCGLTEGQRRLELEKQKLALEKKKFEAELKAREEAENGGVTFVFEPPEGVTFE